MKERSPYSDDDLEMAVEAYEASGQNKTVAAASLGVTRATIARRLKEVGRREKEQRASDSSRGKSFSPSSMRESGFYVDQQALLDETPEIGDILHKRRGEFERRDEAERSRQLIKCSVFLDGPIGILHFGDPHLDDPGTSIVAVERHTALVRDTVGLFGAPVGDLANHWVGRLARLHAYQTTTEAETWKLIDWFVTSIDWLYIIGGNHDLWVGDGDPIHWMVRGQSGLYEAHGARLGLQFPNGKEVRVNVRHDWPGHSQWNTAHGIAKAAQMGVADHIVIAGHKHISGYQLIKQPNSGLVSHAVRVASYKIHDNFAKQLGLKNQNISPSVLTVINPDKEDDDPGLITVFHDVETGVEFLKFLRKGA